MDTIHHAGSNSAHLDQIPSHSRIAYDWSQTYQPLQVILAREREWLLALNASTQLTPQAKYLVLITVTQSIDQLAALLTRRAQEDTVVYVEPLINQIHLAITNLFVHYIIDGHGQTCVLLNKILVVNGITDVTLHPAVL